MSEQKKQKAKIIDRRGHPLPEGHPFKGGAVFFTGNMSEAQKQRLRERFGSGRHSSEADGHKEKDDREDSR